MQDFTVVAYKKRVYLAKGRQLVDTCTPLHRSVRLPVQILFSSLQLFVLSLISRRFCKVSPHFISM